MPPRSPHNTTDHAILFMAELRRSFVPRGAGTHPVSHGESIGSQPETTMNVAMGSDRIQPPPFRHWESTTAATEMIRSPPSSDPGRRDRADCVRKSFERRVRAFRCAASWTLRFRCCRWVREASAGPRCEDGAWGQHPGSDAGPGRAAGRPVECREQRAE